MTTHTKTMIDSTTGNVQSCCIHVLCIDIYLWSLHHTRLLLSCRRHISCSPQRPLWFVSTCRCWPWAWSKRSVPHRILCLDREGYAVWLLNASDILYVWIIMVEMQSGRACGWKKAVLLVSPHPYMVQLVPSAMWHSFTGRWIVEAPSDTGAGLEQPQ